MPFNGSGTFSLTYTWGTEAGSPPIAISKLDTQEADIATGLSNCITKDGQTTVTANIPFNDKRITNIGAATADADALNRVTADARYLRVATDSFTGTLTGYASGPTGTVGYRVIGNVCTLWANSAITGTSNAGTLTMTGIPTACRPASAKIVPVMITDNGTASLAQLSVSSAGVGTFSNQFVSGTTLLFASNAFTSSGTKGVPAGWTATYPLD